jgi:glutamate synthase domain-containing protein 1
MCGIAGRILSAPGKVGRDLVDLMDAQEHRGADSTGFAIYGAPRDTGYVIF